MFHVLHEKQQSGWIFSFIAWKTAGKAEFAVVGTFFSQTEIFVNNKIEGTPILKLAMVKK